MDELSEFAVLELQRMQVQKSKRSASAAVAMEASMLEVYNENVVSLLPPSADGHGDAVSAIAAQAWQRVESAVPLQAAVAAVPHHHFLLAKHYCFDKNKSSLLSLFSNTLVSKLSRLLYSDKKAV